MDAEQKLAADVHRIQQISIIPTLLDVICRTTGMGFAAVARVTQTRWVACTLKDDISFGLKPGDELKVETTICNEIRDHNTPVIIDHVDKSPYLNHHTPNMYGFQSYISVPVVRKNGDFFGTLCAIDPKPALLNKPEVIGMFTSFAELIAFHLESLEMAERTNSAVLELNKQLNESVQENRQYQYISSHNLQEPLRKLRLFSDILGVALESDDLERAKEFALKINTSAQRFSMMIQDLSEFKQLNQQRLPFEIVDLNKVVKDVRIQMNVQLQAKQALVTVSALPSISAVTVQIEQLFFHLINNAIKFSKEDTPLQISITWSQAEPALTIAPNMDGSRDFIEIRLTDNGKGIDKLHLEKIFDIFSRMDGDSSIKGEGIGLAYCRKIVRNHHGSITAASELGKGTTFTILLPLTEGNLDSAN